MNLMDVDMPKGYIKCRGRNGLFDLRKIEVIRSGKNVYLGFASRKPNVQNPASISGKCEDVYHVIKTVLDAISEVGNEDNKQQ